LAKHDAAVRDHDAVSGAFETNVRLPACAVVTLRGVAERDGVSQAAALRRLLNEFLDAQRSVCPDDRLTHVSTLLRYPLARRRDAGRRLSNDATRVLPVRIRVPDRGTLDDVRALALLLPGQPQRRGHEDYQARTLTDAVMTAIAMDTPFQDPFLNGLLPLVRHRAAQELWHLVVELTLTRAERSALARPEEGGIAGRTAAHLEQDAQAWHHDLRVEHTRLFARAILQGPDARRNEQLLRDGRSPDAPLQEIADDLREVREGASLDLVGDVGNGWNPDGHEGRGGTAVWRASHAAALEGVADWLAAGPASRR